MNVSLTSFRPIEAGRGNLPEDSGRRSFGTLLRDLRFAAGLTQEALAERAQLGAVTVGALERGFRSAPRRETVVKLSDALELAADARTRLESAATRPARPRRRGACRRPMAAVVPSPGAAVPLADANRAEAVAGPSLALQVVSVIVCGSPAEALTELSRLTGCVLLIGPPPLAAKAGAG